MKNLGSLEANNNNNNNNIFEFVGFEPKKMQKLYFL